MRGLDGNYLKMQGEMLARMQVAYQAEQVAQQTRAQTQNLEALRQLREQVQVAEQSGTKDGPAVVDERKEREAPSRGRQEARPRTYGPGGDTEIEEALPAQAGVPGHVDLRI